MAEQQPLKTFYPAPPPFYTHFTQANIVRLNEFRQEHEQEISDGQDLRSKALAIPSLPLELSYLVPPEPPADGRCRAFGVETGLNVPPKTLEDHNIETLVPDTLEVRSNPQPYLLSLARSMLTTFLALTGVLAEDPTQYADKVEDLKVLLYNIHELINHYRPHQARETLILMMEDRVEKMRNEVKAIEEAKARVEILLRGMKQTGESQQVDNLRSAQDIKEDHTGMGATRRTKQRAAWQALQAIGQSQVLT